MENNCVKLFKKPSTIVEFMVLTNSDGWMHAETDAHTYTKPSLCDNYVLLTASRLDNNHLQTTNSVKVKRLLWSEKYEKRSFKENAGNHRA